MLALIIIAHPNTGSLIGARVMSRWCALALGVTILSGHSSAQAQQTPVIQTITRWGLLGTWAVDCDKPGKDGSRLTYALRNGVPASVRDLGGGRRDIADIGRAFVNPDGSLVMRLDFSSVIGSRYVTLIRGPDAKIRATVSQGADGSYTILDGKFVHDGAPTRWQARCNAPQSLRLDRRYDA
jgi:hypothetical protein